MFFLNKSVHRVKKTEPHKRSEENIQNKTLDTFLDISDMSGNARNIIREISDITEMFHAES